MNIPAEEAVIIINWAAHSQTLAELVNAELSKNPGCFLVQAELVASSYSKTPEKSGPAFMYNLVLRRPRNGKTDGP
jgi:hypothetical protein